MGVEKILLVMSLAALSNEPVDTTWRQTWQPSVLLTREHQTGSMNHATLAFQVGLVDAYNRRDMATLQELADWAHEYMRISRTELGLKESPHSRIYLEWVLMPWVTAWSVYSELGWHDTAEEIHDWIRATLGYLSLAAINRPAMVGQWSFTLPRRPWRGVGIAVPGARSWSFEVRDGEPLFHHLDRWNPDWILAYLLGRSVTLDKSWPAEVLKGLRRIRSPNDLLTAEERRQMRRVVNGRVPSQVFLGYLAEFLPGDRFSYLRFQHGTVGVMHTARHMHLSTAALQAAKLDRRIGDLEVLALDTGVRNVDDGNPWVSRPTTTISPDYSKVTARASSRAIRSLDISDLGRLIYHIEASPAGVRVIWPPKSN